MKFPTILLSLIAVISAMTSPLMAQAPDWDAIEIKTTDLGDGVYMLEGRGGNIGVSVGEDGVFIIDDQFAPLAPKIVAAISAITDKHVDYVINTHWHGDHTGGNEYFGGKGAVVVAHDNVRVRMAAEGERQSPYGALPVITFSETTTFHYNGHEIHAFHPENAHTDGDAIIHFRDIDLIHAGDVLFNGFYPYIDTSSGGSVEGYIAALESLSSMVGPDTRVISGHGPVASKADIEAKIAMLKSASASISALIAEGKSLEEAKAADPLAAYNDSWGAGFINGERMTEMLYNALK
jgi:glyoxylase-like metal-dependent hydrolase (beta-lactamase superfamily II)